MFPGLGKGMSPRKMQQMTFWKKRATDQQPERFSMRASLSGGRFQQSMCFVVV